MSSDWKLIFATGKLYLAEIAKDILEEEHIEVVLMNKQDSVYLFGDIELFVKPDDVVRAKFLLKDL